MRERRWESTSLLSFAEVLAVGERLAALGLKPAVPEKDVICYVEEWRVDAADEFDRLDAWATEDVTLLHIREDWQGDFFLLAGAYHTVYRQHQDINTYCSVSHPWRSREPVRLHQSRSMCWVGFRLSHAFIRVRLHTGDVITPGEGRGDKDRARWLEERRALFLEAITLLDLTVETTVENGAVVLTTADKTVPFFCSWPDAFGPCQFEYNSSDAYEFLVPAGKLAATMGSEPVGVRVYLTGFSERALEEFHTIGPPPQLAYRCSVHSPLDELPEILSELQSRGRVYTTLCELQTQELLPACEDASAIVGVVGEGDAFRLEVRLNRAPLPEDQMAGWLERLLGYPVVYAPLPPFV
jgi:hypothetical protein